MLDPQPMSPQEAARAALHALWTFPSILFSAFLMAWAAEGAQFGPHLVNGRIEGYKIARVNDDHVFAKLGARSGDIIRKVNGYALSDTERMLDLWKAIRTAPEVKIELEREGKTITYDFQIRN